MAPNPGSRRRVVGRVARGLGTLLVLAVVVPLVVALGRTAVECRVFTSERAPEAPPQPVAGLVNYARPEDQTFLTLPEWYIVYSSDEYAAFIAEEPPSRFPYFGAVAQFWQSYGDVCGITRDRYPFNSGYHLSLVVIGTSFTVENVIKGIYENSVGRLTELVSSDELTEEDAYARRVAAEYGTFLHTIPWYEFPFGERLRGLWGETSLWGPNGIRKLERKLALSAEYGTKAIYGWLIRQGTQGVYGAENLEIYALAEGLSPALLAGAPEIRVVEERGAGAGIVAIPRYEAFTQLVPGLARQGLRFVDIAGNDTILITLIAPRDWRYTLGQGAPLFALPILTDPDSTRVAVEVPVAALGDLLRAIDGQDAVVLEHIYDY